MFHLEGKASIVKIWILSGIVLVQDNLLYESVGQADEVLKIYRGRMSHGQRLGNILTGRLTLEGCIAM
jgi:hypothetical protein